MEKIKGVGKKFVAVLVAGILSLVCVAAESVVPVDDAFCGETSYGEVVLFLENSSENYAGVLYTDSETDEVVTALGTTHQDGDWFVIVDDDYGISVPYAIVGAGEGYATVQFADGDTVDLYRVDVDDAIDLFNEYR